MKPSLKTIAEQSGVSKTTVSFVLNGRGDEKHISADTQKRVLDTARRLNYQPNHLARSLSMGRSYTIGFVVPDISNPFFGKIARLVEAKAELLGYSVMVASTGERAKKEQTILESFKNRQIDGVLLASATANPLQRMPDMPLVYFDRVFSQQTENTVDINNCETARLLTEKLINKGHQRIALISLSAYLPNIKARIKGYREALDKNNLAFDEHLVYEIDEREKKKGVSEAVRSLLNLSQPPTGFLFLNNVLAAGGIWTMNQFYPERVSGLHFASFDNLDLFDFAWPRVTSALQPSEEIAAESVRMLIHQIEQKTVLKGVCLSTTIIDR
ncbi:LacI family DNA-binding transcriptional regulator [Carboxylicivirga taeanensis]|uniref:LacI family DNA-binding transcriptional regulator n=1 Tax=Carboxylicivirga taeanensis TaxID=1416875 RepID=UPI003F6DCD35